MPSIVPRFGRSRRVVRTIGGIRCAGGDLQSRGGANLHKLGESTFGTTKPSRIKPPPHSPSRATSLALGHWSKCLD